jgi:hypothetical protein
MVRQEHAVWCGRNTVSRSIVLGKGRRSCGAKSMKKLVLGLGLGLIGSFGPALAPTAASPLIPIHNPTELGAGIATPISGRLEDGGWIRGAHCRPAWNRRQGWHQHWEACRDSYFWAPGWDSEPFVTPPRVVPPRDHSRPRQRAHPSPPPTPPTARGHAPSFGAGRGSGPAPSPGPDFGGGRGGFDGGGMGGGGGTGGGGGSPGR